MAPLIILSALLAGAGTPAASTPSPEKVARDSANNEVILSQYPARARAAGEQGSVVFKVALDRQGYATSCEVTQSSGYKRLDQETCDLILDRGMFKGIRGADGRKTNVVTEGVVNWRLPKGEATAAAPVIRTPRRPRPRRRFAGAGSRPARSPITSGSAPPLTNGR
jgi:TonB family protein